MDNKILYYLDDISKLKNNDYVPPVTCEIDLSNKCNNKCKFCFYSDYLNKSNDIIPTNIALDLLDELKLIGVKSITWTGGGEPTLHPDFNEIAGYGFSLGLQQGLITNGTRLHKISNLDKFTFIRVSLNAGSPEVYEKITGTKHYWKVVENIHLTLGVNSTIGLSYVVNKDNECDISKANDLAKTLGVAYIQFKPASGPDGLYQYQTSNNNLLTIDTQRFKGSKTACMIAHLIGIVQADCNVVFCCQMRDKVVLGNLKDDSFGAIWKRRLEFMEHIDITKCPTCRYSQYANAYQKFIKDGNIFVEHKDFL